MKKSPYNPSAFWFLVLAASLFLNAYILFYKKSEKMNEVLASGLSQSFRWKDIRAEKQRQLKDLDVSYYRLLKSEVDLWAENLVVPKEAQTLGMNVEDFFQSQLASKSPVTEQEVLARYAASPSADSVAYPQVLDEIRGEIQRDRLRRDKADILKDLFAKYGVRFLIKAPDNYVEKSAPMISRFPVYELPVVREDLDAKGQVIAPPSKGDPSSRVVLEIYSDFMCPYSKRFDTTLKAVAPKYADKIRLVYHHFPLPFHTGADVMAQAASCAQEQKKFWEYHDRLMASADMKPEKEALKVLAGELGLDRGKFDTCLDSGRYEAWVKAEIAAAQNLGITGTPTFFMNGRRTSGALPPESLSQMVDWMLDPKGEYPGPKTPPSPSGAGPAGPARQVRQANPVMPVPGKPVTLPADWLKKGVIKGPDNAPVTLVEFFDYNCPFCQRGASIWDQLDKKFPGKIRVHAKQFPLPMHPNAMKTSEALLCANEQGKFWDYRAQVVGEFWGKSTPEDLKAIAKKVGLKEQAFTACLDTDKTKPMIDEDMKVAAEFGVGSTPTFFVNGVSVIGAQPIEVFEKSVEDALAKKKT